MSWIRFIYCFMCLLYIMFLRAVLCAYSIKKLIIGPGDGYSIGSRSWRVVAYRLSRLSERKCRILSSLPPVFG